MLFKTNYNKKGGCIKEIFEWFGTIVMAIALGLFITANIGSITQIKEQSMEPSFIENDKVIIYKLGYMFNGPKKGDVIILNKNATQKGIIVNMINEFKDVVENITYRFTGIIEKKNLIKRVVGVEGDLIDIKNGKVYINNMVESGYDFQGNTLEHSDFSYPIEIPKGKVFVLGDNRENSLDSRALGLIDLSQVKGKAKFRIWPFDRIGMIK